MSNHTQLATFNHLGFEFQIVRKPVNGTHGPLTLFCGDVEIEDKYYSHKHAVLGWKVFLERIYPPGDECKLRSHLDRIAERSGVLVTAKGGA